MLAPSFSLQSVQAVLQRVAEQPFDAVEVLGSDLPKFASFYVSFILFKALADMPRKLLQTAQFVYFLVRFRTCPDVRAVLCASHPSQGQGEEQALSPRASAHAGGGGFRDNASGRSSRDSARGTAEPATPNPNSGDFGEDDGAGSDVEADGAPPTSSSKGGGLATSTGAHFLQPTAKRSKKLQDKAAEFGLSPREYFENVVQGGSRFRYEDDLTDVLFVLLIGFIFGAMVPILPPLIALTMAVMGMVYKYKLVYRKTQWMDSGAAFIPMALNRLAFGAGGHCAVISALLYEREQVLPASTTLIPLLFLVVFMYLINRRVLASANELSLREAVEGDVAHGRVPGGQAEHMYPMQAAAVAGGGQEDDGLRMRRLIGGHAYVPDCMIPARDTQPGVVLLPPLATPTSSTK